MQPADYLLSYLQKSWSMKQEPQYPTSPQKSYQGTQEEKEKLNTE